LDNPILKTVPSGDLELAVWEWEGDGPALLFAHATGFHGRTWDYIARMFPGRRRVAIDFRGHGRSSKPAPPYRWPAFGCDLALVAERLGITGAIGIGHSMGGHSVVSCMLARRETFASLVLVDPTIFPRDYYGQPALHAAFVRKRKNEFQSADEMFERFRNRLPFGTWRPEILRDYCDYGLLPRGDGFVLACPPEVEASIYEHSKALDSDLYPGIPSIDVPVTVMRAMKLQDPEKLDASTSPAAPDLAAQFPHGRDVPMAPGCTHYIPMEVPELVAVQIHITSSRIARSGGDARP